jgi:AcrR family transcriptional regulator
MAAHTSVVPDMAPARRALLEAAIDLFHQRGYDGTSVREIVAAAGLTKGAFYHYFASKDDLLQLIHDDYLDRQLAALEAIRQEDLPARAKLERVVHTIVEALDTDHKSMSVFMRERRALSPAGFERLRAKRDLYERELVGLLEEGVQSGEFEAIGDAKILAFGIVGMCAWGQEWYSPSGPWSAKQIADWYARLLLHGLVGDN